MAQGLLETPVLLSWLLLDQEDAVFPPTPLVVDFGGWAGTFGSRPSPSVSTLDDVDHGGLEWSAMGEFYFRIWVIPSAILLDGVDPTLPIPFQIFNAYLSDNTLDTATATDLDGFSANLGVLPSTFAGVEIRDVDVLVLDDTPRYVDGSYLFTFSLGSDTLHLYGNLGEVFFLLPDAPITEMLEWKTSVITSHAGGEQRIALRGTPRRMLSFGSTIEGESTRRAAYNKLWNAIQRKTAMPYFQYATTLTAAASIGATTVYCDTAATDLRVGELAMIYDPSNDFTFQVTVATMASDHITTTTPLLSAARVGAYIMPVLSSRLENRTALAMDALTGHCSVKSYTTQPRTLQRPGASVTLETLSDLPVLPYRHLANETINEAFDAGYEVIDNGVAPPKVFSSWPHPFIEGTRQYLINRVQTPADMDWWRAFLDHAQGQLNPFWLSTWREDLFVVATTSGSATIDLLGTEFARQFSNGSHSALQFETAAGVIRRGILSIAEVGGLTRLTLSAILTGGETTITRCSFLNLCRLASDTVTMDHQGRHTIVTLETRTIDA